MGVAHNPDCNATPLGRFSNPSDVPETYLSYLGAADRIGYEFSAWFITLQLIVRRSEKDASFLSAQFKRKSVWW